MSIVVVNERYNYIYMIERLLMFALNDLYKSNNSTFSTLL